MKDFRIIIPARYASTRLPAKVLKDIAGKTMLQHVYERGLASGAKSVVIATDDERIAETAHHFGAEICMTSIAHRSGTERLAEAVALLGYANDEIIVNLQGDEPLMPSALINQVAENLLIHEAADMSTLCEPLQDIEALFNPNVGKVVLDAQQFALYFSRAPIPWDREAFAQQIKKIGTLNSYYRHIGIYAYRASFIKDYIKWPVCALEEIESLEQLRALWNGARIYVASCNTAPPVCVDTEEDLERVRQLVTNNILP